ncbi:hypothetical protein ABK429_003630 [Shigella sonnei]
MISDATIVSNPGQTYNPVNGPLPDYGAPGDSGSPLFAYDKRKRLVRTVLIFTESSDQLSRATDRVPGLPASPGYVQ